MNATKQEAIATADAWTNNADLPTYSELVASLMHLAESFDSGTQFSELVEARDLLARIPA